MGALPVLELDDSSGPTESLPIIEYLEEPHPDPPMIGIEPLERVRVRERERFAEMSILNRITLIFVNPSPLLARRKQAPQAAEQARGASSRAALYGPENRS
jgi:glutathione S-transferase